MGAIAMGAIAMGANETFLGRGGRLPCGSSSGEPR